MWPFRKKRPEDAARKTLKLAQKLADGDEKRLTIIPPEGVPLDLRLATLGQRLGAQITDVIVTMVAALVFVALFAISFSWNWSIVGIVATLTFFLMRLPYYIITELTWNGRTLAKRWLGIRVVSVDGTSLSPHQIVIRNLMKEIEFFMPLAYGLAGNSIHWTLSVIAWLWILILLIVPWRNRHNQRIGDIIANTAVILDPKPVLLPDIAKAKPSLVGEDDDARFVFSDAQLDQYGRFELQVLEQILRAPVAKSMGDKKRQNAQLAQICGRIVAKIGYEEPIQESEMRGFLEAFYSDQRAYLENRKLYGDARENKFFKEEPKEGESS